MTTKKRQFNHQVVEIDPVVKRLITRYIELFPNQKEAARRVGVSACTINTYNTRSTHIALYVFDKIIRELTKALGESALSEELGETTLEKIRSKAKRQNGAQIDNVMYIINPAIRKVLDLYIEPYPSREAGGANLGLNPRTFTAYFKGQISSFPRKYFWMIVDELRERGMTDAELLREVEASEWDEVLIPKKRSHTLQVTKEQLIEKLVNYFKLGTLKEKDIQRSVANAAERLFGNLGTAIRATMKEVARRSTEAIKEAVAAGNFREAVDEFNRLEGYLALYRTKEIQVNKALPRKKKLNINRIMRPYLKMTQELYDTINEPLIERNMALYKIDPSADMTVEEMEEAFEEEREPIQYRIVRRYASEQSFNPGEIIDHPGLGIGEVLSIKGRNRMVIQFNNKKYGTKELVMNGISYPDFR